MTRLLFFFLVLPFYVSAQKLPTIEEKTKDFKKQEGYINFYWDENAGKVFIEIAQVLIPKSVQ